MDMQRVCYGCFQKKTNDSPVCLHCGFNAEEEQPFLALPLGTLLRGRYITGRVLGVGGFGITYLGYDLVLEIRVAIKEYMPSGLATRHADRYRAVLTGRRKEDYENGMERFLEEARILARLQGTPNIVSVQDHFKENNTAYFVMEYVDGMSLKAYLASQGGKIPCGQALTILQPVMEALIRVHSMGLTHRDISPDNISITSGGESKLLDFGAARSSMGGEKSVSVILKHGFAPEEQYSSHGSQGPWTDVYAMGATLYRCVTGQLPPDSIARVHSDTLKKPSELGIVLPAAVEAAMMKAMAVKAEDRFPSMEAFLQAVTGKDAGASLPKAASRFKKETPAEGKPSAQLVRNAPAFKIAALAVCAAILGMGIFQLVSGSLIPTDNGQSDAPVPALQPDNGQSGAQAQAPQPDNGQSDAPVSGASDSAGAQPDPSAYTNTSLNFSMDLPPGFAETAPGSAVFLSPDESCSLQIGFYTYWAGFPVYSLADAQANSETYVRRFIGLLQSTDVTEYAILHEGYRQIGTLRAYQVQFEATESGGSSMGFAAVFIEGQNGFGCYNVIASYPRTDEAMQQELLSSIESFRCLGPAKTDYKLFSDERLPFRFLYAEGSSAWDFSIENGILTALSMTGSDSCTLTLSASPSTGVESATDVLEQVTAGLENVYPGIGPLGEQKTLESGGMEWAVRSYAIDSEGIPVYISYAAALQHEQAYLIIFSSSRETQLDANGLTADIMGSLRPAP